MSIKTTVGQAAMVGGDPNNRPSGILVDERTARSSRARRRGNLYILIEISGLSAGRDIVAGQLLQMVHDSYYGYQGTVTAGLQQAILEANSWLFNENRNALPAERRAGGISCAVLRDGDLFIAQAGPAAVYLAHEGQVTRFPDASPWLDDLPLEDADAAPLGGRRELNVALFHTQVAAGDIVLCTESSPARRLATRTLQHILASPSVEDIVAGVVTASGGGDVSALAVKVEAEGAAAVSLPATALAGAQTRREPTVGRRSRTEPKALERFAVRGWLQTVGRWMAAALAGLGAALMTLLRRMLPGQVAPPQTTRPPDSPAKTARSADQKRPRDEAPARPRWESVRKPLIALAIGIPVIVAAIVLVMYAQRSAAQKAELEALWQNANESWKQASLASDKTAIRTQLKAAEGYIDQLLVRSPGRADAQDLRKQMETRLDEINLVQRISWVARLKSYPAGARLSRVIAEGEHIFVMDPGTGKVYHHRLDKFQQALEPDSQDSVLLSKGQRVGNLLVGDLVDMVWVPVGERRQQANLVILESNNALIQYDPTTEQLSTLAVAATDAWRAPKVVGSYYGRFYVVDPTANKIWRYEPTQDGYSEAPDDWLKSEADLMNVKDMAIGDSIYLLNADGVIRRFTTGEPATFDIADWDAPPSNPGAIFTRPPDEVKSVYVADRGNQRIIQSGLDGRFERQFRLVDTSAGGGGDALSGVTSLFVNEIGGHAFFTTGQDLYMIVLPEPK